MIDRQIVLLAKSLRELKGASLAELEGRIAFQKKIYLPGGGRQLWITTSPGMSMAPIRGLARDGVQYELNRDLADRLAEKVQLWEKGSELFDRARKLMELPPESTRSLWLEIPSIHFRCSMRGVSPIAPEQAASVVIDRLLERKPHLRTIKRW